MRAVDTNILVRLIVRDDVSQTDRAEAFVSASAWVSHLVLAETVWVLQSVYGLSAEKISVAIGMLLEHDKLALQDEDIVRAALSDFMQWNDVGFTDCLIVRIADAMGHRPLGTFDKALSRLKNVHKL